MRLNRTVRASVRTAAGGVATVLLVAMSPGAAVGSSLTHPDVVSEDPADFTPNLQPDDAVPYPDVYALNQLGDTMYAGGDFHTVADVAGTAYTRTFAMAFSATTGAITPFAPVLDGRVWAIEVSDSAVYLGGQFTRVNGFSRPGIVKLDAVTGRVDRTFVTPIQGGRVSEIRLVNGRLIVGGSFEQNLVALDPATGRDTGYLDLPIDGKVANSSKKTEVYRFAVNPSATKLVAVGNFTSVNDHSRQRAVMLALRPKTVWVNPWYYQPLSTPCRSTAPHKQAYLTDVDFSPDGSYFVLTATGGVPATIEEIGTAVCDAAARFEMGVAAPAAPTWINYTGGDTLYAVGITGAAVYVQGHNRWLNNPYGQDSAGPGAVERPGLGAIDPATGLALAWNPVKPARAGGKDFLVSSTGLWVGSDSKRFHGEDHYGLAFCPLP